MKCPTSIQLCPLHTHTVYSVLDGASTIDEYVDWCVKNGAAAIGTTDHGWAIGALETYVKAKKAGISALPGCEFYVVPDASYKFNGKPYDYYHVTAWAVGPGDRGYRNLIKLASLAWQEDTVEGGKQKKDGSPSSRVVSMWGGRQLKPRITFDELLQYNEGLVLGTGCLIGAVNKALLNGEFTGAERNLLRLLDVYKGRVFAEIMPHACDHNYSRDSKKFEPNPPLSFDECKDFSPDGKLQVACNNEIIRLAKKHKIPLLMTIDSHFVRPEQKRLQDVLLSTSDDGWTFYESYHMYDTPTAWEAWQKLHGSDVEQQKIFTEAVEGNAILAGLAKDLEIKDGYHQPEPVIPEAIAAEIRDPKEQRRATILGHVAKHGRMQWDNPVWLERLDRELKVICDNGIIDFSPYFLFLEKTYDWAAESSIFSAPGRGSGAGSLLCYLLKITHLDPIAWNLPFERFLSQARLERGKFPDIDCIASGTVISKKGGRISIEKLSQLDPNEYPEIACFNSEGQLTFERPLLAFKKGTAETFEYQLDTGDKITCTPDHRVLTAQGWVSIDEAFEKGLDIKTKAEMLFEQRSREVNDWLYRARQFCEQLPDSTQTQREQKQRYFAALDSVRLPTLKFENGEEVVAYENGEVLSWKISATLPFPMTYKDRSIGNVLSSISALMSGKKYSATKSVAMMRRQADGSFSGSEKTRQTKLKTGQFSLAAQKVAANRRLPDGSYKGRDKTIATKMRLGINKIAAQKTAITRRLEDGTYKGADNSARIRKSRPVGRRAGKLCVYQRKSGEWITLRSTWEWCFARELDDLGVGWEYEPISISHGGKYHIPDFRLDGGELVEIKPKVFLNRLDKDYLAKYNICVLTESELHDCIRKHREEALRYVVHG